MKAYKILKNNFTQKGTRESGFAGFHFIISILIISILIISILFKQYGIKYKCEERCPVKRGIMVKLDTDRRIFTLSNIVRASYIWTREYNKRASVERVNSKLGESFEFQKHYIREKLK